MRTTPLRITAISIMLIICFSSIYSCKVAYSLSGASLSPKIKTVSISYFDNRASLINPTLSQNFTEALKDKFTSEAGLSLTDEIGDIDFTGFITSYNLRPVAVGQNEADMMRLSISIDVKFTNKVNPKQNFKQTFTDYADYKASQNFSNLEESLNATIIEKLVEKIFMKSATNW